MPKSRVFVVLSSALCTAYFSKYSFQAFHVSSTRMRIFNLTFLLLTILVILSAVDVGECRVIDKIRAVFENLPSLAESARNIARVIRIIRESNGAPAPEPVPQDGK
ncbi:unnamed protein product [Cylicocyclus nassatus]|uniref:Uncharacterized protein n=1 Tax=Cylicocyclus nassatus TaxID=53992 RepID=A0AA36GMB2_CYLNA|nr:unnamed protein product [Cylicocyclus nassatus]